MNRGTSQGLFAALVMLAASAAVGADGVPERATYIVALADPPLAAHAAARLRGAGLSAQDEKIAVRGALLSADSDAYLHRLDAARGNVLDMASRQVGRALAPRQIYRYAANGVALELSADEAQRVATLPGVAAVRRERVLHVQTDAGPAWIGANTLWNGQAGAIAATKGEGTVIGVVDTGINPTHPSFAAAGGDGYTATNPRGHFYGLCTSAQAQCNAKLIGIYDFTTEGTHGVDSVGHGSHTAGIAAGNAIADSLQGHTVALPRNVSGVAPHANLIAYKGCNAEPIDASSDGTCAESALVGAIDQATADQVDVINYSIGGGTYDPYELLADPTSDSYAMFHARAAGVVIAVSAGNDGPGPKTLSEPGNAPWVIGVANASHNRRFVNSIGNFSGAPNAPATLNGQGYTSGYGPATIVYAGNYGNALCGIGTTEGVTPTGASNPFPAGTFHGEIVICDRGTYARVEKGYNVKAGGAGGFILANAPSDGASIISDDHYLPAVHLGYTEGQALKAWVATGGAHSGKIGGVSAAIDASFGDILDSSSSRGPFGFGGGLVKPDLTAPGDNILSAAPTGNGLALLSGTSMASPHVAGAAALVLAAHPSWSPAQVESTLIGTALADVRMQDGVTAASPTDAGAGRVQPAAAVQAGLYLPLNSSDFFAGSGSLANPTAHGNLSKLNRVGLENEDCFQSCSFNRTVADNSEGGTWQISSTATAGATVTVTPNQFTLAAGATQALKIDVDVSAAQLAGSWVSGRIVLHKTGGKAATDIALSLAAYATPGATPAFQQIVANAPVGDVTIQLSGQVALPHATFTTTSLAPAVTTAFSLGVDPQSNDVYGTFPGIGKQFVLFPNVYSQGVDTSSYGRIFVVEVASSNAVQTDLYAGIDSNGDGKPSVGEESCHKFTTAGTGVVARCVVDLRGAGAVNVWALVDIPTGGAGATYDVTLSSGIPTVNVLVPQGIVGRQLHVVGPGSVPALANFPLRLFWGQASDSEADLPIAPGNYYGAVMVDGVGGQAPSALGQAAVVPLSFKRNAGGDDVADALSSGAIRQLDYAGGGETLKHVFIDVPEGATTLAVDTSLVTTAQSAVSFSIVRADFPAAAASAQVAAAPGGAPAAQWTLDAVTHSKHVVVPVTPGRWYIPSSYSNSIGTSVLLGAQLNFNASAAPALMPGNYFNPQRSGHGIFLSQGGGQQVVDWYTFLEDGTPTWYVALNAAPAASVGTWSAPLYRAAWDGTSGTPTQVGDVIVTATSANHAMFSWHLYGQTGSEAFELIAAPACVSVGGNAINLNGEWFPPAQSGYGFDALVLPGQQFDAFYMYDGIGNPRWVVGAIGPFAATSTIPMLQSTGFCPLCTYQALTTQAAGSMTVGYTDGSSGNLSTAITLNAPLSGSWNINQPIARLTGTAACGP